MKIEFKVYGATLESVRDDIAQKLRAIAQSKPSGENLVCLRVGFKDSHYFHCNDEMYFSGRVKNKSSENEENEDWSVTMQKCEDGIIEKLEATQFTPKYCAEVTAVFSDENTWL